MARAKASQVIQSWPKESRDAAELVLKAHGEPDEASATQLTRPVEDLDSRTISDEELERAAEEGKAHA